MVEASTDALSPWVATLRPRVVGRLEALLGLPGGGVTAWLQRPGDGPPPIGLLVATLAAPDGGAVEVELRAATPGARAWIATDAATLSYRKGRDGSDPWADPGRRTLLEAVAARFREAAPGAWDGVVEAVATWRRFEPVQDWMLRQISWSEAGAYGTLRLGFRCNQDCSFCWQGRDWPSPPDEVLAGWLDELAAAGVTALTLSGGEPTLHPALPALVERAARVHGMRVELQTNAIQLRRPALTRRLREAGLVIAFVSYHSHDAATSDAMTRAPGTWARTVEGIRVALAEGLSVQLNAVVERQNHATLAAYARDVVARFVAPFPDNPVELVAFSHPCEYYEPPAWADAVVPLREVADPLVEACRILREAGVTVDVVGSGCGFPPCLLHDAPELIRLDADAAFDRMDRSGRVFGRVCEGCALRPWCLGLRREYHAIHGEAGLTPFTSVPEAAFERRVQR